MLQRRQGVRLATRPAILLGAVAAGLVLAAPAVADVAPDVKQRFAADSGDKCRMGVTVGVLVWPGRPDERSVVHVTGAVADVPDTPCGHDHRYTVAYFTAYSKRQRVEFEQRSVDDEKISFDFDLGDAASTARPVDLVTVRVCRLSPVPSIPYDYCGTEQFYTRP
jgi:hypothetical protein